MDMLSIGWKMGVWFLLIGYMFAFVSIFLTGLSMMFIVFLIKLVR